MHKERREITINNLINITNNSGILTTGSKEVALNFGKQHKNVLQNIDNIMVQMNSAENSAQLNINSAQNLAQYFISDEYRDSSGKLNRQYQLTRDGFTLLVMGFTGAKALQWKLKYIEAFNKMEEALKSGNFSIEPIQLQCIKETNKTLKFIQDKNLRDNIARQVLSKLYDVDIPIGELRANRTINVDQTVTDFINAQCYRVNDALTKINVLHECYLSWCSLNKIKSLSKIYFGRHMKLLGFEQEHRHMGRFWKGIKIKVAN